MAELACHRCSLTRPDMRKLRENKSDLLQLKVFPYYAYAGFARQSPSIELLVNA